MWQTSSRIGETLVNDVGALCWNELATSDVEQAKTFFGELLGWEYETDERGYVAIRNAGSLNGGIREQSEQELGSPPNWLPYFTVENADEAARSAVQLGGRILIAMAEIKRGRFAIVVDPQSAAFALSRGRPIPSSALAHATSGSRRCRLRREGGAAS